MQNSTDLIIEALGKVQGLYNITILNDDDKKQILELEDENNIGVFACLSKKVMLALSHDSTFRQPAGSLVMLTPQGIILPALPFPEIKEANAVSSSPSRKVHDYLISRHGMKVAADHATLLIGFDA